MRLPKSTLREALLFPVDEIRLAALDYFAQSFSRDAALMPLVIQSVQQYGRDRAYRQLRSAEKLPQTAATVGWITEELGREWPLEEVPIDNYCFALARILLEAPVELLRPEMVDLRCFPSELKGRFIQRLEMAAWDWDTGWAALMDLGRKVVQDGWGRDEEQREELIAESLARHPQQAGRVLALLDADYDSLGLAADDDDGWEAFRRIEPALPRVAGRMRLTAAVPALVAALGDADDSLSEESLEALQRIGGEAVVEAVMRRWPFAWIDFRLGAAEVLENVHTDSCAAVLLPLFVAGWEEEDQFPDVLDFLSHALLGNFVIESVEPIRRFIAEADADETEIDEIKFHLVAAATLMGVSFPELEAWHKQAEAEHWGWWDYNQRRAREEYLEADLGDEGDAGFDDEFADEDDWETDDQFDEALQDEELDSDAPAAAFNAGDLLDGRPDVQPSGAPAGRRRVRFSALDDARSEEAGLLSDDVLPEDQEDLETELDESGELEEYVPPAPIHRRHAKVGRNDPCPCGSGKKYKKCCLSKDKQAQADKDLHADEDA